MLSMQPVYLLISFAAGSIYAVYLNGARKYFSSLKFALVMFAVIAVLNPLFNHRGLTVLFYLAGEPVTLEAFAYGLCAGLMLLNVFIWFSCYACLLYTSDITTRRYLSAMFPAARYSLQGRMAAERRSAAS